jgi:glycosyltransferase involved in cell wall biosynthesis
MPSLTAPETTGASVAPPAPGARAGAAPLLVFSDDWGRHPSSCQHLVRRLLDRRAALWVNTIGTRAPRLDLPTMRRGLGKVRQWLRPAGRGPGDAGPPNLRVLNPRMWPWLRSRFDRWLNRRLLVRQLTPAVRDLPEPPVAITTLPVVADLMGRLPVRRWVYYCVDDFSQWPGLDQDVMRRMEAEVVARADVVVAVSEPLQERLARMGRPAHLLTHGVDLDFWTSPTDAPLPDGLDRLERPWVVFWGVVDRRMDVAFVNRLAADLTRGTVLLVGPEQGLDPALFASPRVVRVPPVRFAQLPRLAREAGVLVMPYADLPVTRAMQPLKLKEYLATGRPVVARDLPANRVWVGGLDLADSPAAFSEIVRERLHTGLPDGQRQARARLAGEGWGAKARAFAAWALGEEETHDSRC